MRKEDNLENSCVKERAKTENLEAEKEQSYKE